MGQRQSVSAPRYVLQRHADGRIRLKLLGEAGFSLVPPKEGGPAKILISKSP